MTANNSAAGTGAGSSRAPRRRCCGCSSRCWPTMVSPEHLAAVTGSQPAKSGRPRSGRTGTGNPANHRRPANRRPARTMVGLSPRSAADHLPRTADPDLARSAIDRRDVPPCGRGIPHRRGRAAGGSNNGCGASVATAIRPTRCACLVSAVNDLRVNDRYLRNRPGAEPYFAELYRLLPDLDPRSDVAAPTDSSGFLRPAHHLFLDALTAKLGQPALARQQPDPVYSATGPGCAGPDPP